MIVFGDLEIMARTVFGEARGEERLGKIAVAWVIVNRWKSGRWFAGDTLSATCLMPWQFSCWNPNDPMRPKIEAVTLDKPSFRACTNVSLMVIADEYPDPTSGATHYYASHIGTPVWAVGKTVDKTIGRHLFFRNID